MQCEATAASKAAEHAEAQKDEQHVQLNSFHSKVSINDCKYEEDSVVLETHRSQQENFNNQLQMSALDRARDDLRRSPGRVTIGAT